MVWVSCRRWVAGWSNDSSNIICQFPLALCTYLCNENIYIEQWTSCTYWQICAKELCVHNCCFFRRKSWLSKFDFCSRGTIVPANMIGYQWQSGGVIWVLDQSLVELVLDWETRCWVFNDPVTCDCSSCCSPQIVVATPQAELLLTLHWLIQLYMDCSDTSLQMRDIQCILVLSTPSQDCKKL